MDASAHFPEHESSELLDVLLVTADRRNPEEPLDFLRECDEEDQRVEREAQGFNY